MKAAALSLLVALAGGVASAQPAPAPQRSWQEDVRCLGMMERTPELMRASARMMRGLKAPTPEAKTMQDSMARAFDDTAPAMLQAIEDMRTSMREDARRAVAGGDAAADQAFDQELQAARAGAGRFVFTAEDEDAMKTQMEAFNAELERICGKPGLK